MAKSVLDRRPVYSLLSGLLFIGLGLIIFIRGNGFKHFLNVGLIGFLFAAYGIYRLTLFAKMRRRMKEGQP
jgi:uncharacterized membrane protein HdeD (DUF308 family)